MATATSSSQVTLRWNPSTDVGGLGLAGYLVFRNGLLIGTTTATVFADTTVAPNTSYCYTIIAYDIGGNDALASAENCITTPSNPPGNLSAPGFYVDYSAGSDSNPGTNAAAPWKHCPGDPNATGKANTILASGSTVYFKGGEQYVLTGGTPGGPYSIGIAWQSGVTYDGSTWAVGSFTNIVYNSGPNATSITTNVITKANITDNYSSNFFIAFASNSSGTSNVTIRGFDIGPMGGANPLPANNGAEVTAKNGYGVSTYGGNCLNLQVLNCDFHQLGYWQNTEPMGPDSMGSVSPYGVGGDGLVGCTVSNCTFTEMHTGVALTYIYASMSNVTVTACNFHDYMVWGLQLATGCNGNTTALNVFISYNKIHDIGWAYGNGWTGYSPSDSGYHQDPFYEWLCTVETGSYPTGSNVDVYGNNFYDSEHTTSVFSAGFYMEGGMSVNIYNNLFNYPNVDSLAQGASGPWLDLDDSSTAPSLVRFINNTVVFNQANQGQASVGVAWYTENFGNQWPTNHYLQCYNNVIYDFCANGSTSDYCLQWNDADLSTCYANWNVDHDLYHSENPAGFGTWYQGSQTLTFGLSNMRSWGFEANGLAADPLFVSIAYGSTTNAWQNNYGLQPNSPAIGAGTPLATLAAFGLPGLLNDITGKPRTNHNGGVDLGAYQH
jgi:hypothetical protein